MQGFEPPATLGNPELPERLVRLVSATTGRLKPAAVLMALTENGDDGPALVLTRRTERLKHHAGQISFPGGARESNDDSLEATALREAEEEVGLRRDEIEVVSRLAPHVTVTGFRVTPYVALVRGSAKLRPDPTEVAEVFSVPFGFFLDESNLRRHRRVFKGFRIPVYEYHFGERVIWGATAGMIVSLIQTLEGRT